MLKEDSVLDMCINGAWAVVFPPRSDTNVKTPENFHNPPCLRANQGLRDQDICDGSVVVFYRPLDYPSWGSYLEEVNRELAEQREASAGVPGRGTGSFVVPERRTTNPTINQPQPASLGEIVNIYIRVIICHPDPEWGHTSNIHYRYAIYETRLGSELLEKLENSMWKRGISNTWIKK